MPEIKYTTPQYQNVTM